MGKVRKQLQNLCFSALPFPTVFFTSTIWTVSNLHEDSWKKVSLMEFSGGFVVTSKRASTSLFDL